MAKDKSFKSFDEFVDVLLNKDLPPKEPPPKQESFQEFIDKVTGKK